MAIELYPPLREGRKTIGVLHKLIGTNDKIAISSWADMEQCISQHFGENRADYYRQWGMKGHNATDFTLFRGADIIAAHDGEVIEIEDDISAGLGITLWNKEGRFKTMYWHLKVGSFLVKVGDQVKRGEKMAEGNNTGYSTGDHLHFALKETDYRGGTINYNNGYKGAIDDRPYRVDDTMLIDWNGKIWAVLNGKRFWVLEPETVDSLGGYGSVKKEDASKYPYAGALMVANTDEPK